MKILIPSKYFSIKCTYILGLTALSFSGLKYLLMSLYFGFVCIFFPSKTCRVYRKYAFCHLKPFSSLFSTFSPHMHLFASDTWEVFSQHLWVPSQNQERGTSLLLLTPFVLPSPSSDVWPAQILNFSHLLMVLPGGMGCGPISSQSSTGSGPGISGLGPVGSWKIQGQR